MTYQPLPYADADTTAAMHTDCSACAHQMRIPRQSRPLHVMGQAPSIAYADLPREVTKTEITVSDAAARLAAGLHLHLH